MEKKYYNKNN